MNAESVGAVVLAAGNSSRLGQPKQLLLHRGEPLVKRAARAACAAGCHPVIVVTGAEHAPIQEALSALHVHVHRHKEWARGMGSSIRVGVEAALALDPALGAIVLLVCDQPFVAAETIAALLAARTGKAIAACAYGGTMGVPALFERSLFPLLTALPDDQGAKQILAAHPDKIARVDFPQGGIDIDTPADFHGLMESATVGI